MANVVVGAGGGALVILLVGVLVLVWWWLGKIDEAERAAENHAFPEIDTARQDSCQSERAEIDSVGLPQGS